MRLRKSVPILRRAAICTSIIRDRDAYNTGDLIVSV